MQNCWSVSIPFSPTNKTSERNSHLNEANKEATTLVPHRQAFGNLISDISVPVSSINQFSSDTRPNHIEGIQTVLLYMKETRNGEICYAKGVNTELLGFSNTLLICSHTDRIRARFIFMAAGGGASSCKIKLMGNACLRHPKTNTWHLPGHRRGNLPSSAVDAHVSEQLLQMPVWRLFDIT